MALRKFLACTLFRGRGRVGCRVSDGTGKPFTPTLPSTTNPSANADGTVLKATAPAPAAPANDSQIRNLRPTLTVVNAAGTQTELNLTYTLQLYEGDTLLLETSELTSAAGRSSAGAREPAEVFAQLSVARARTTTAGLASWLARGRRWCASARRLRHRSTDRSIAQQRGRRIVRCVGEHIGQAGRHRTGRLQPRAPEGEHGVCPRSHHRDGPLQAWTSRATSSAGRRSSATTSSSGGRADTTMSGYRDEATT
jgi:hypothetical protein